MVFERLAGDGDEGGLGAGGGVGGDQLVAGGGDVFEAAPGGLEVVGLDESLELVEGEVVVVAQVEDGHRWIEQVVHEGFG